MIVHWDVAEGNSALDAWLDLLRDIENSFGSALSEAITSNSEVFRNATGGAPVFAEQTAEGIRLKREVVRTFEVIGSAAAILSLHRSLSERCVRAIDQASPESVWTSLAGPVDGQRTGTRPIVAPSVDEWTTQREAGTLESVRAALFDVTHIPVTLTLIPELRFGDLSLSRTTFTMDRVEYKSCYCRPSAPVFRLEILDTLIALADRVATLRKSR